MRKLYFLVGLLGLFLSCSTPQTKEDYMKSYEKFINEVKQNHKKYTLEDWKKADEKYKKFTGEWRQKFDDEFTLTERGLLLAYDGEYKIYRLKEPLLDVIKSFKYDDYDKLKEQISKYKNEKAEEDLKKLEQKAKEVGGEFEKAVNEIFKELGIEEYEQ